MLSDFFLNNKGMQDNKNDLYLRYFQHANFISIVGVGKRGEY